MIVCIDLDGTVSSDPEFYRSECRGLMDRGHAVHVLTGNPHAAHTLAELGMVQGRDFTRLATMPRRHISRAKVAYMQAVRATHLIDNRKKNIRRAIQAGFTGHHHIAPKAEG